MYEVIVILKALTEVAGVAFLGQGVLWVLTAFKIKMVLDGAAAAS